MYSFVIPFERNQYAPAHWLIGSIIQFRDGHTQGDHFWLVSSNIYFYHPHPRIISNNHAATTCGDDFIAIETKTGNIPKLSNHLTFVF